MLRGTVDEIRPTVAWVLEQLPAEVDSSVIDLGLTEALTNAVAHGVNGLEGESRDHDYLGWLDRLKAAEGRDEGLRVALRVEEARLEVHLRWRGRALPETAPTPAAPAAVRGRGTTILNAVFQDVVADADGFGLRLATTLEA
ncbi:MAG: ATP-binding protein [Myxococcota bacterium]